MTLHMRLMAAFVAALLALGLWGLGLAGFHLNEERLRTEEAVLHGYERLWRQVVEGGAAALAARLPRDVEQKPLAEAVAGGDYSAFAGLIQPLHQRIGPDLRLDLISAGGEVLFSTTESVASASLLGGGALARVLGRQHPFFGLRPDGSGRVLVTAARPLIRDGRSVGALLVAVAPGAALRELAEATGASVVLLGRDGPVGTAGPALPPEAIPSPSEPKARLATVTVAFRLWERAILPLADAGGGQVGTLVLAQDITDPALRHEQRIRALLLVSGLLVVGVVVGLGMILTRALSPLRVAVAALEELAAGRSAGYVDLRPGPDLPGQLAGAVDRFRGLLHDLHRFAGQRERRRRRQERFIRRQMETLAATLDDSVRQTLMDELQQLGALTQENGDGTPRTDPVSDELGVLALAFSRMTARVCQQQVELSRMVRELRAALEDKRQLISLQQELEIAANMQASILPRAFPSWAEVEVAAHMMPAREVGGDFYDVFPVDEHRVAVVVADVSGKGIPAAFFMMVSRTMLRAVCQNESRPATILCQLNDLLAAENEQMMFVTVCLGILELHTGAFTYCSGGHDTPIRVGPGHPPESLARTPGMALAAFPDGTYGEATVQLAPGDALVLFTDGVTEAFDPDGNLFGMERLLAALTPPVAATAPSHAGALMDAVTAAVTAFANGAPPSDDLTCVVLHYRG